MYHVLRGRIHFLIASILFAALTFAAVAFCNIAFLASWWVGAGVAAVAAFTLAIGVRGRFLIKQHFRQIWALCVWTRPGLTIVRATSPTRTQSERNKSSVECDRQLIRVRLQEAGIAIDDMVINHAEFKEHLQQARYPKRSGRSFLRKASEYYVAAKVLSLSQADVYIDIASSDSPIYHIFERLFGCIGYRQDMIFTKGIVDNTIGGDATCIPVPDQFGSKMSLHCSFEHFEGDSDFLFIREAGRILRPGGVMCIVPLYLKQHYTIRTDPATWCQGRPSFEEDAVILLSKGFGQRHARFYDAPPP